MLLSLCKILSRTKAFFSLNGNIWSLNAQAASWGSKATMSTRQGGLAHSHYCRCDHLAVAALASLVLVGIFKREVASWVFVLEDLREEASEREHTPQRTSLRTVAVDFTGQPGCLFKAMPHLSSPLWLSLREIQPRGRSNSRFICRSLTLDIRTSVQ